MTVAPLGVLQTPLHVSGHNQANAAAPGFEPSHVIFQAAPLGQVRGHVEHPPPDRDEPEPEAEAEREDRRRSESDMAEELIAPADLNRTYSPGPRGGQTQNESIGRLLNIVA